MSAVDAVIDAVFDVLVWFGKSVLIVACTALDLAVFYLIADSWFDYTITWPILAAMFWIQTSIASKQLRTKEV